VEARYHSAEGGAALRAVLISRFSVSGHASLGQEELPRGGMSRFDKELSRFDKHAELSPPTEFKHSGSV
jgi:hypothetical protein